jgi:hypothetical protein
MSFTKSEADPNVYDIFVGIVQFILVLFVDDLFLTSAEKLIARCKVDMVSKFKMKDVGMMHYFLGLEI